MGQYYKVSEPVKTNKILQDTCPTQTVEEKRFSWIGKAD